MDISVNENEVTNYESSIDKNDFIEENNSTELFLNQKNHLFDGCDPESINECHNTSLFESQDNDDSELPIIYADFEFIISRFEIIEKNNLYNLNLDEEEIIKNSDKNYVRKELMISLIKNKNNKKKLKKEILKNKSLIKEIIREQRMKLNSKDEKQYNVMNIKRNRFFS